MNNLNGYDIEDLSVGMSATFSNRFQRLEGTSEYLIQVTQKVRAA